MSTVTSTTVAPAFHGTTSVHGQQLAIDPSVNNLGVSGFAPVPMTNPCVNASIAVTDETTNVRNITITLKDAKGIAIAYTQAVQLFVFSDATRTAKATGGSTGIAIGASGLLYTHTAKLHFTAVSTAAGVIALTWTDTGTESVSLAVLLPNGTWVTSTAFANT